MLPHPIATSASTHRPSRDARTSVHAWSFCAPVEHDLVVRRILADDVVVDPAAVLRTRRVARVPEPRAVRLPRHRWRRGCRRWPAAPARRSPRRASAARCPRCHPRSARARPATRPATDGTSRSPPPRRRRSSQDRAGHAARRSDPWPSGARATNWSAPRRRSRTNSRSPRSRAIEHRRQRDERGQALVPPTTVGPGIERLSGVCVLGGDPLPDLGRVTGFQPTVGIGDRRRRGRRRRRPRAAWAEAASSPVSHAPCWGACRGWPWSGASGPCASWSSSTWVATVALHHRASTEIGRRAAVAGTAERRLVADGGLTRA